MQFYDIYTANQKLKSIFNALPEAGRKTVLATTNQNGFAGTPKAFRGIFGIAAGSNRAVEETIAQRMRKINTVENVAPVS